MTIVNLLNGKDQREVVKSFEEIELDRTGNELKRWFSSGTNSRKRSSPFREAKPITSLSPASMNFSGRERTEQNGEERGERNRNFSREGVRWTLRLGLTQSFSLQKNILI